MSETTTSGLGETVATVVEMLAKDAICTSAPKLITALQKDHDAIDGVVHPIKKELVQLLIDIVKDAQTLCNCPQ